MIIPEPNCFKRNCKHLKGVKIDDTYEKATVYCEAFPNGIPHSIAYGRNKHLKPYKGQKNQIVYEKQADSEIN
jgi:hypothetical protein